MGDESRQIAARPMVIRHVYLPQPAILGGRYCRMPVMSKPSPSVEPGGAGIAPALLLVLIRRGMVEPERFHAVRERRCALAAQAGPPPPRTGSSCALYRCNCST